MQSLMQNLRFSLRMLARDPGVTLTILLTLALGIGANTAIFTVDYQTLLAPLPYHDPNQLVAVWSKIQGSRNVVSVGDFLDWKQQSSVFQDICASSGGSSNLSANKPSGQSEQPEYVPTQSTSPGFYNMNGVGFYLGRDILPDESVAGKDNVVILTYKMWKHLGGNPRILGTQVRLDGVPHTVVGVLVKGPTDRGFWQLTTPLVFKPEQINHDFHSLFVMGRLKPGVTLKQAQDDMDAVAAHIAQTYPTTNKGWGVQVEQLKNTFMAQDRILTLWLLLGGVGFILLIACVNVANLLLAKSLVRQKEMAVRSALGASRRTLFAQMITESLLLAIGGGILGIGAGFVMIRGILAVMPENTLPSEADMQLNLPILLFALAAVTLAGLFFGCAPALFASRIDPAEALKEGGRTGSGRVQQWLRRSLVIAEFALALALLAGAGLVLHSFRNLQHIDLGVRTDHILTFFLPVPETRSKEPAQIVSYYRRILDSLQAVPGVSNAAVMTGLPLEGDGFGMPFTIAGKPAFNDLSQRPLTGLAMVTPDYFRTFGMRLVHGRPFGNQDTASSVKVAMVNEEFASKFLKGTDPLEQRISMEQLVPGVTKLGAAVEWQIVGVFHNVSNRNRNREEKPEMLIPFWQTPWPSAGIAVRTVGDPEAMTKSVAGAVHSVDPEVPVAQPKTMEQIHDEVLQNDRFTAILFSCFAAVALLLAAVGIYGVMSFSVAQRAHDIALRMALGAGRYRVLAQVIREGLALATVGLAIGLIGAFFLGQAMQSMLFGIGKLDFTAFGAVAAILLTFSVAACYPAARRAASLEPMQVLRNE
jgi:putative ABC transport system permease protein